MLNCIGRFLDWLIYRGADWDTYWLKQHVKRCHKGYVWRGGILVGFWEPCWHCNKDVYTLERMVRDRRGEYNMEQKARFKDALEAAKLKREQLH